MEKKDVNMKKILNNIFSTDSITVIQSLPDNVLIDLYNSIKKNLHLFTPEQKEKVKPIVTYYNKIKFQCECNQEEYGKKRECESKCRKLSIYDIGKDPVLLIFSFLSFKQQVEYLKTINQQELIFNLQKKDKYNPDIIIKKSSPLEQEYRQFVMITTNTLYKTNPRDYKKVKYLYKTYKNNVCQYDVIYNMHTKSDTIINIKYGDNQPVFLHNPTLKQKFYLFVKKNQPLESRDSRHIKKIQFGQFVNQNFHDIFKNVPNLQLLNVGPNFNHPIGDSLATLTNLQTLELGFEFDQLLNNSLVLLTKLHTLDLGYNFNHPINDSLATLTNLQTLQFGYHYNQPLENSLTTLTKLQTLNLGYHFNQPLNNSLATLTNLQIIHVGNDFNQPLENSLATLTNLQTLDLGSRYNHPFENSLSTLKNLQTLYFGDDYNQPFNNSLDKLIKLQTLQLGTHYNQPFKTTFYNV